MTPSFSSMNLKIRKKVKLSLLRLFEPKMAKSSFLTLLTKKHADSSTLLDPPIPKSLKSANFSNFQHFHPNLQQNHLSPDPQIQFWPLKNHVYEALIWKCHQKWHFHPKSQNRQEVLISVFFNISTQISNRIACLQTPKSTSALSNLS